MVTITETDATRRFWASLPRGDHVAAGRIIAAQAAEDGERIAAKIEAARQRLAARG